MTKLIQSSLARHFARVVQSRHLPQAFPTAVMCLSINYTVDSLLLLLFIEKCWLFLQVSKMSTLSIRHNVFTFLLLQLFRKSSNKKGARKLTRNTLQCWWRRWKWPRLAKIHLAPPWHFWVWLSNEFPPMFSKSSSRHRPKVYSTCWAVTLKVTTACWFDRWSAVLASYFEIRMFQPGPLHLPYRFTTHWWHSWPVPSHRFEKQLNTPFGNSK